MLIEQAIFTSTQSIRLDGYQIAASSRGIDAADLRELSVWGPSHDSLLEAGEDAVSINFHPLPSGAFCISKTTPAGSEYSGRSGHKIYTQCFVTPRSVLARFANNPFAVLNAAFAQGSLKVHDRLPEQLEPFRLAGKTAAVDRSLLGQLLGEPGPAWLSALIHAALTSTSLALVAGANSIRLISGLINCLPPECRTEFSFCTGLKHSPRRPFRILSLASDSNEQRRMLRQQQTTVLEPGGEPPQQLIPTDGWSGFVAQCLASGNIEFLAQELSKPRPGLVVSGLKQLGNELLEHLGVQATSGKIDPSAPGAEPIAVAAVEAPTNEAARPTDVPPPAAPKAAASTDDQRRADAAHRRFQRAAQALAQQAPVDELEPDPAQVLGSQCPAALEQLERLDDTVFEAIAGKPGALDVLRKLWPEVLARLGPDLIEESREQYVRHALRVWRDCLEGDQIRNPALAVAAMDVVCLLFNE